MDEKEVKDNRNKLYYHIGKLVNIHIFIHYYNLNAIGEICIKELCMQETELTVGEKAKKIHSNFIHSNKEF